jgi:homopolymeric O-antigen transport system permease protein
MTAPSISLARAVDDLRSGWRHRVLWGHLGWQDIRQRYRRSVLGPVWISISMAVTAVALGILYAGLFGNPFEEQLPYILVGLIVWGLISGCINEGVDVFISNVGLIHHLPAPLSVHVYRLVWRQMLFFAHNLVVYAIMLVVLSNRWTGAVSLRSPPSQRWRSTGCGWRCCSASSVPGSVTSPRSCRASSSWRSS